MIKLVILVFIAASSLAEEPISLFYHKNVGIKAATRIKQAEETVDFDGSGRISGGWNAPLGLHPHAGGLVIALTSGATSVCGCSLLSNTRAITAANCWWDGSHQARQFTVVLGSTTLFTGGTRVVTTSVNSHGSFNPGNLQNNIAMININSVTLNNNIQPALLPFEHTNDNLVGAESWIAGFGQEGDGVPIPSNQILRHVKLRVISNAACNQVYGSIVQDSTICTEGYQFDTAIPAGTCGGDSGSGLWMWMGGSQRRGLIGVASFHHQNGCQRGFPSGYVRVTSYIAWIQARL